MGRISEELELHRFGCRGYECWILWEGERRFSELHEGFVVKDCRCMDVVEWEFQSCTGCVRDVGMNGME